MKEKTSRHCSSSIGVRGGLVCRGPWGGAIFGAAMIATGGKPPRRDDRDRPDPYDRLAFTRVGIAPVGESRSATVA
jgi:hypothetical protein